MSRDPEFYLVQAERLVTEGQYAAAELMLRQAAELGGNNRVYVAALAALLGFQEGRGEEALTLVQEHLAAQPDDPNLLVVQGHFGVLLRCCLVLSLGSWHQSEEKFRFNEVNSCFKNVSNWLPSGQGPGYFRAACSKTRSTSCRTALRSFGSKAFSSSTDIT